MIESIPWSVCSLIINEKGLILATSRKDDHEIFGLPGGKVDPEDLCLASASVRELKEETGVIGREPIDIFTKYCPGGPQGQSFMVKTFMYRYLTGRPQQILNEGKVVWATPYLLCLGPFSAYNEDLFSKLGINTSDTYCPNDYPNTKRYIEIE